MEAGNLMNKYVAYLRTLYLLHQNAHWQCASSNFYGNHLLFQRIYEDVASDVDEAAEKTIGLFGNEFLNFDNQIKLIQIVSANIKGDSFLTKSLETEKKFSKLATKIRNELSNNKLLSLGLEDMIISHINKSENRCYLLEQANIL